MNQQQEQAATAPPGYLQIVAGPGTGKTRTLVARIVHFLNTGLAPRKIVVMTFTNQAAKEVRYRVSQEAHLKANEQPLIGTFHGIASRILSIAGVKVSIASEQDKRQLVKKLCLNGSLEHSAAKLTRKISYFKARGIEPPDSDPVRPLFEQYNAELRHYGLMDFDDLLLQLQQVLTEKSSPYWQKANSFCQSIQAVLVDEFQDTNVTQLELANLMAQHCRNLTVVGDPDQSIYGFRNAEPRNFNKLIRLQPTSQLLYLEQNYRSTSPILDLAMKIINGSAERYGSDRVLKAIKLATRKPAMACLRSSDEEARQVCDQICALLECGVRKDEIAVLARRARSLSQLEANLVARGVSVQVVGGTKLSESPEVRIIVDYLRVIASDTDELALIRAINIPKRKIGPATVKKIFGDKVDLSRARTTHTGWHEPAVRSFLKIIDDCRAILNEESVETLRDVVNYLVKALHTEFDEKGLLRVNLLHDTIAETDFSSENDLLGNFIAVWTLSTTAPSKSENVVLSTVHSAKGLEWPVVYMLDCGASDGYGEISLEDADEERRLVYVAATRAQALLTISFTSAPHPSLPSISSPDKKLRSIDTAALGALIGRKLKPYSKPSLSGMPGFTLASSLSTPVRPQPAPQRKGFVPLSEVFGRPRTSVLGPASAPSLVSHVNMAPRARKELVNHEAQPAFKNPRDEDPPKVELKLAREGISRGAFSRGISNEQAIEVSKRRKIVPRNPDMVFAPFKPPTRLD